jgi:YD repeat-containing protein
MDLLDRLLDSLQDPPSSPATPAHADAATPEAPKPAAAQAAATRRVSVTVGVAGAKVTLRPDLFDPLTATANENGRATFDVPPSDNGGASLHVEADGFATLEVRLPAPIPDGDAELDPVTLQRTGRGATRRGIVGLAGRSFRDEGGTFYPLGGTLFWAARGWKFERDRVQQNIAFLAKHGYDYFRMLGEVGWKNNDIDPRWPDYRQVMGELVDWAWDAQGLRVEVTLLGGGTGVDPMQVVDAWIDIAHGREQKILSFEAANESFQNGPDADTIHRMCARLRQALPNVVAPSSPAGFSPDEVKALMGGVCNLATAHLDRAFGDEGWRAVRQAWDFKDVACAVSHNEPIGPASSVKSCDDPLVLTLLRATGILCGGGAFVLHNGAGVSGQPDPVRGRTANLWEMPNIDRIMEAVRGIDAILPPGVENWTRTNDGWASPKIPLRAAVWDASTGPVKHYAALHDDQFVQMPHGIKDRLVLEASRDCTVKAFDPLTLNASFEGRVKAGERVTLPGDPNRHAAYIIVGG